MSEREAREPWLDGARAPLLEVRRMSKAYPLRRGPLGRRRGALRALEGFTLHVEPGETLALVGESGCGKTTAARSLLRLVEPDAGEVLWRSRSGERVDLRALRGAALRRVRRELGVVFQDPYASLDPRRSVRSTLSEPLAVHGLARGAGLAARVDELLEQVGLPLALAASFPHQLSGGERQRVAIARALSLEPRLLVCDEVTSALDVSVQAQILTLLERLRRELSLALLLVAHDLGVVRHMADRVAVLYAGRLVEVGPVERVLGAPAHPYTRALLAALPAAEPGAPAPPRPLAGDPPSGLDAPSGCVFHPRCALAEERCRREDPAPRVLAPGHVAACHLLEPGARRA